MLFTVHLQYAFKQLQLSCIRKIPGLFQDPQKSVIAQQC